MATNNILKPANVSKRKVAACIFCAIVFTKIGTPNLLYILQYIGCIIKLLIFKKRIKYAAETAIYRSRVHLYDIDFWLHLNNAAYLRHAELARVDFFMRTQLWQKLKAKKYGLAFVAVNIRYRRELTLFKPFEIRTRPIFWNEYTLIMEQKFVNRKTKFVHTIIYGKYVLIKNGKKVKRSLIEGNFSGDGLHLIDFYEKAQINELDTELKEDENETNDDDDNALEEKEDNIHVQNLLSFVEKKKQTNRTFYNVYDCRNIIPDSLGLWMKCLEQSHHESRRNLLEHLE